MKRDALKSFTKFTEKHLCWELLFNNIASIRFALSLKKSYQQRRFTVNFAQFLRHHFYRTLPGDWFCLRLSKLNLMIASSQT